MIKLTTPWEQVLLEHISGYLKEKQVAGDGKHGFIESKLCLTNPSQIACSDRAPGVVDERRVVNVT